MCPNCVVSPMAKATNSQSLLGGMGSHLCLAALGPVGPLCFSQDVVSFLSPWTRSIGSQRTTASVVPPKFRFPALPAIKYAISGHHEMSQFIWAHLLWNGSADCFPTTGDASAVAHRILAEIG